MQKFMQVGAIMLMAVAWFILMMLINLALDIMLGAREPRLLFLVGFIALVCVSGLAVEITNKLARRQR